MQIATLIVATGTLTAAFSGLAPRAAAQEPMPFGLGCRAENGVRYCPAETLDQRVPSFDGVPIDIDVTLPATGDGPFPTVALLPGLTSTKADLHATRPQESPNPFFLQYYLNDNFYAKRGYAVLSITPRGFGRSCGVPSSRTPDCERGWTHLADQRFEARDVQWLLGQLVDQGVASPDHLAIAGNGYGGAIAVILSYLRDRVRELDGSLAPWTSPAGAPLSIGAVFATVPWSDVPQTLFPNGRFLETRMPDPSDSTEPVGILRQSYANLLVALMAAAGYLAPPGADPSADIRGWLDRFGEGEPYGDDVRAIADELSSYHQGFGLPGTPAPMLLQAGWSNDILTPIEILRIYVSVRANDPDAPIEMQLGDYGDARGSNNLAEIESMNIRGADFIDAYLRPDSAPRVPSPGQVSGFLQTCPQPPEGSVGTSFSAPSWSELHPGVVRFGSEEPQVVDSEGGSSATADAFNPVRGVTACNEIAEEQSLGTAVYTRHVDEPFTLLGLPMISAEVHVEGANGQLASRLWDVSPAGQQRLISRGVYRLIADQRGPVTFQLNGNGYRFERGHTVKLELLGNDEPYFRKSNTDFSVTVTNALVELPVAEPPNGGLIEDPAEQEDVVGDASSGGCSVSAVGDPADPLLPVLVLIGLWLGAASLRKRRQRSREAG